jgi:peptidylprolyl isomerase
VTKDPGQGERPGHRQGADRGRAVRGGDLEVREGVDASWKRGQPFGFTIAASPSQVIPGWDKGLVGQNVGSRVMLVVPPADGYGKSGNSQAGIKGTDTLVFVVDVLGAFN